MQRHATGSSNKMAMLLLIYYRLLQHCSAYVIIVFSFVVSEEARKKRISGLEEDAQTSVKFIASNESLYLLFVRQHRRHSCISRLSPLLICTRKLCCSFCWMQQQHHPRTRHDFLGLVFFFFLFVLLCRSHKK